MSQEIWILAATFAAYFAAVLAIGWVAYRRTATIADFVLGGRRLGSFLAVSWTDVLQGLLMAAVLVAVPVLAVNQLGGLEPSVAAIGAASPHLFDPFTTREGSPIGLVAVLSLAVWGLGYFGQPHILARFQGIRSAAAVPKARRIAVIWVAVTMTGAILTGLAGIPLLDPPLVGGEREKVFIQLVDLLFNPWIAGICLAAILAAVMSTADSQLLVSSAAFTEDIYRRSLRPQAGPKELVAVGRLSVLVLAGLAFLLALDPEAQVLDLVGYAWAGFGAAFGPALLLSLYWPRMTARGALGGILTGGLTVVVWKQLDGGLFDLYELVPGFLLSWLAVWGLSLLDRPPGEEAVRSFAAARARLR